MIKNLVKAVATGLLLSTSVLAADVNGTFKGQGPNGPVMLQIQPGPQGYLVGRLRSNGGVFAVVSQQNGDQLIGMLESPQGQPMQFSGMVHNDGSLVLSSGGSTVTLEPKEAAASKAASVDQTTGGQTTAGSVYGSQNSQPVATPADPNDDVATEMQQLANQASRERAAEMAAITNPRNTQPAAAQNYPGAASGYGAYGQAPVQANAGYCGGTYQTGGAYQTGAANPSAGNYTMQQAPAYPSAYPSGGYAYTPYTPMPQQPAVNYNQPNDGSAIMQQYEQQQAAQDQISLQRSDTMREQNRYVGEDGTQYTAPENATQVTVDQGGQATYTTEQAPTPPADETVATPYSYSSTPAEGDGN
jgi:hypothetical protein